MTIPYTEKTCRPTGNDYPKLHSRSQNRSSGAGVLLFDKPGCNPLEFTSSMRESQYPVPYAAKTDLMQDAFAPIQTEYKRLLADKTYLDGVLTEGARRAAAIADRTVTKVYKRVGFLQI